MLCFKWSSLMDSWWTPFGIFVNACDIPPLSKTRGPFYYWATAPVCYNCPPMFGYCHHISQRFPKVCVLVGFHGFFWLTTSQCFPDLHPLTQACRRCCLFLFQMIPKTLLKVCLFPTLRGDHPSLLNLVLLSMGFNRRGSETTLEPTLFSFSIL